MKRSLTHRRKRLTLEELEPRQLLSADVVPLPVEPAPLAKSAVQEAITSVFAAQPTDSAALLSGSYELVFVDPRVPDSAQLLADFAAQNADGSRHFEIITLDPSRDGIVQVTEALADRMQVDAVHFITHGSDAAVQLGGSVLNAKALAANAEAVASWGHALKDDADLLFYGCDLASSASGRALMDWIAELTQADVAASTDKTGAAEQGGNWTLEYQNGPIEAQIAVSKAEQRAWNNVLATFIVNVATDANPGGGGAGAGLTGDLRYAITQANASVGVADTITFNIAGAGVHTINLAAALPTITDQVLLDGTTQSGWTAVTPMIVLNGAGAGAAANGLTITASNSTVQGLVINGFSANGILITNGDNNVIRQNFIGTNATATAVTAATSNSQEGIRIDGDATGNLIGGAGGGNVIAGLSAPEGSSWGTIRITGALGGTAPSNNLVQGNWLGTNSSGANLGNGYGSVEIDNGASGNMIGGVVAGQGNVIAYSNDDGILVYTNTSQNNSFLGNSIYSVDFEANGDGNGIDLAAPGDVLATHEATANDAGDGDPGPNALQNFPAISSSLSDGTYIRLTGTLNSTANTNFRIEFFASPTSGGANGYREGKTFLGAAHVTTDGSGNVTFTNVTFNVPVAAGQIITATATRANGTFMQFYETSEFSQTTATVPALTSGARITGTLYEDVDGDADIAEAGTQRFAGATVRLYQDLGVAGTLQGSGTDTLVTTATTDAFGNYAFIGLANATYWVAVDSTTIAPSAGFNAGSTIANVWAEQTYGDARSVINNAGATLGTSGAFYGGKTVSTAINTSDNAAAADTAEHVFRATIAGGADVTGLNAGFSFNVVTNTRGDANDDDGGAASTRHSQGTLYQFIQNANAIAGANTMRFVPAAAGGIVGTPNVGTGPLTSGGDDWWQITVTAALPQILDASTTIDGTAYDATLVGAAQDATPRDTNTAALGYVGSVGLGTDAIAATTGDQPNLVGVNAPELEIVEGAAAVINKGIDIRANDVTVRRVSIHGFGNDTLPTGGSDFLTDADIWIGNNFTGTIIEDNVIGSGPGAIAQPANNQASISGITSDGADGGIIRRNVINYAGQMGIWLTNTANGWTITLNDVSNNVWADIGATHDAIAVQNGSGGATITGNYVANNQAQGFDGYNSTGSNWFENNTFVGNGSDGLETSGVRLWGPNNTFIHNIVQTSGTAGAGGAGVLVAANASATGNLITQNSFSGNFWNSIDLISAGGNNNLGDGVGVTVSGNSGNGGLARPTITSATLGGTTLTVSGTSVAGATIEIYRAAYGGAPGDGAAPGFGEGEQYLGTTVANGAGNWSSTFDVTGLLSTGQFVSAIAIDNPATTKNTSEFGLNATVVASDASEGFNYATGNINGDAGGTNFAGAWTAAAGAGTVITPGLVDPTGMLLHTGNAAQMQSLPGNATAERLLNFSLGATGTTAWVSFLMRSDDPLTAGPPADYGGLSLGGINSWGQNGLFIGTAWNGTTGTYYLDRTGAGLYQDTGVAVVEDATALLVVRLDFAAGNDTATLYINPTPGLGAPDVGGFVKNNIDLGTWSRFVMTAGNTNRYSFDELRVGTTYGSVTPLGSTVSGTIYNDVDGDADVAEGGTLIFANAKVDLYLDNGDGVIGAGDTFQATTLTNGTGNYSFGGLADGDYYVVVDSRTLAAPAYNGGSTINNVWAEQTYGVTGAAQGGTFTVGTGALFGGRVGGSSDNATALTTAQHVTKLTVAGGDVAGVNSGFSFNVVTNTRGDATDDDATRAGLQQQGTLRQFILNANAITGANAMRFVPAAAPNVVTGVYNDDADFTNDGGDDYWRISVTSLLPTILDASTTIDGTAFSRFDGTTVADTNTGLFGTGGTVGVDGIALGQVARPELEIVDGIALPGIPISSGLDINANNVTIRDLAIWGFGVTADVDSGDIHVRNVTGTLIEGNVVGTTAASFSDPGAEYSIGYGISVHFGDSGIIRNNLIGWHGDSGVTLANFATNWLIEGNEIRRSGLINQTGDGVDADQDANGETVRWNLIADNRSPAVDFWQRANNNTVVNNTMTGNAWGAGVDSFNIGFTNPGTGNVVDRNIITGGAVGTVPGVRVGTTTANSNINAGYVRITQNSIYGHSGLGIDLDNSAASPLDGDGVTPNDATDGDGGPNNLFNFPTLTSASYAAGNLTVVGSYQGLANQQVRVEFFASTTADPSGNGEGQRYLGSLDFTTDGTGNFAINTTFAAAITLGEVITATATKSNAGFASFFETSEFSNAVGTAIISGTIYEDVNGDGNLADGVGRNGVVVNLYRDGGTLGAIDAGDTFVGTTTTAGGGLYSFGSLATGTYYVEVDSKTFGATAYNGVFNISNVWADQTYAVAGAANNAAGTTFTGASGALYGGRAAATSDNAAAITTAEHVTKVTIGGANVAGVDSGFSFNAIVNNRGDNADDDGGAAGSRMQQGSLRQFIQNSNDIAGIQSANFSIGGGGAQTIALAGAVLQPISDAVVLDATTQELFTTAPLIQVTGGGALATGFNVAAGGAGSTIRGFAMSGFTTAAIDLTGGSNVIAGNYIGTNAAGSAVAATPNQDAGLYIRLGSNSNTIGGTTAADRNVISGNGTGADFNDNEITLRGSNNVIQGNYIGVASDGTTVIGNDNDGIDAADGSGNSIGGVAANQGNLIAGHSDSGVKFQNTAVSGTVAGNTIYSNGTGIKVQNSTVGSFVFTRDSIYGNTRLGIDLVGLSDPGNGVTPNDPGDVDVSGSLAGQGPNNLQNFPVVSGAATDGVAQVTVAGSLNSRAGRTYRIEFFANPVGQGDGTGYGEGRTYLGATTVTTDAGGNATFTTTLAAVVALNSPVTATATDLTSNETSEFGLNVLAAAGRTISGTVYNDVNGNANVADDGGAVFANATVRLYLDDGSGTPSAADALVSTTTTNAAGTYSFTALPSGNYWVVVDSKTLAAPGYNGGFGIGDVWADQTYGDDSTTAGLDVAARYGGRNAALSDDAAALATSEHVARAVVGASNVSGVDYGFSFSAITNTSDADDDAGNANRYVQGDLRQFIQNSNAIAGVQASNFSIGSGLATITLTSALPLITDTVVIDGNTQEGWVAAPIVEITGPSTAIDGLYLDTGSDGSTIHGLILNNFRLAVRIYGSSDNVVTGNYLGTDATGTVANPNVAGVWIRTSDNTVGGTTAADRNIISGNLLDGVQINGSAGASGNVIIGNYIGLDVTGTADLGNQNQGVAIYLGGKNNIIGGTGAGEGNVISGNNGEGVRLIDAGTTGNVVLGNLIGTNAAGTAAIANGTGVAIWNGASANTIGGTAGGAGNVISGNTGDGVYVVGAGSNGNVIQGNRIGTNAAGTAAIGNTGQGIDIDGGASNNTVGGTAAGAGNLISGNVGNGVYIASAGTSGTVVQGNLIGTDASGAGALGNLRGVFTWGVPDAQIGGTAAGAGNTIAFNATQGVVAHAGSLGVSILGNSIHSNAALGIDLDNDGVTLNDVGDGDGGTNNFQNFPTLASALTDGAQITIVGTLNSTASQNFRIEFFASTAADGSGYGEGERYLGFVNLSTDGSGNATINATLVTAVAGGEFVSATATNLATNDTSEFSAALAAITDATPPTLASFSSSTAAGFYNVPDAINITATMSEAVQAGSQITVTLDTGDVVVLTAAANGTTLTGTYVVGAGDNSPDLNVASFIINSVQDLAGNAMVDNTIPAGQNLADNEALVVDTTPPAAPAVVSQIANDTTPTITGTSVLGAGETLTVTVNGATYNVAPDAFNNWTLDLDVAVPASGVLGAFVDGNTYNVTATVTDLAGNATSDPTVGEIIIDTTAPAAPAAVSISTDTGVSSTDEITSDQTLVFSGTSEANATVSVYLDAALIGTTTADGAGAWSFDYTGTTLGAGSYNVTATATDAAGNVSALSAALPVVIDIAAPAAPVVTTISTDTGTAGDAITSDQTLVFSGTSEANATVSVYLDAALIGTITADGAGAWSFDYTGTTLGAGSYNVTATATDAAGNVSVLSAALPVTIDITAPAAPAVVSQVTNDVTPTITGTAVLGAGETLTVTVNGATYNVAVVAGNWSLDTGVAVPASGVLGAFVDGNTYNVTATVTDLAGNATSDPTVGEIVIDTTAPAAPAVVSQVTNDVTPTITGTAVLGAGETLTVTVNGATYNVAVVAGNWSLDTGVAVPASGALGAFVDGNTYNVTATVTDLAGNATSDPTVGEIVIDTTAPAAPAVVSQVTNDVTPTITGTAVLGAGETLTVTVNGATYNVAVVAGNWSLDTGVAVPASGVLGAFVDGNTYNVTATVTDLAGNATSDPTVGEVVIDTTAPAAPAVVSQVTNDVTPTITGTAVLGAGETLTVTVNGATYNVAVVAGNWTLDTGVAVPASGVLGAFVDGNTYNVTATVTDLAGNATSDPTVGEIIIDTTAPAAPAAVSISTDTGVSSTDEITSDQTLVFSGTSEANATVSVYLDAALIGTTTADGAGAWSFDYTGTTLGAGSYNVTATATDAAGNVSALSAALPVSIDTTAPAAPSVVSQITNDVTPTITGTAVLGAGETLTVTVNGATYNVAVVAGNWTLDTGVAVPASGVLGAFVDGNTYNVTATVTDLAGNATSDPTVGEVIIDTTAPAPPVVTAISTDTGISSIDEITFDQTLVLSGTSEANATVSVYLDAALIGTTTADGAGAWSFDYTGTTLGAGSYNVTATATDAAGNVSALSLALPMTVDVTAPALNTATVNGATLTLTYSEALAAITPAIGDFTVNVNGGPVGLSGVAVAGTTVTLTLAAPVTNVDVVTVTYTPGATPTQDTPGNTAVALVNQAVTNVTVDTFAPAAPTNVDLAASSDTGSSNTDDLTSDATPTVRVTLDLGSGASALVVGDTVTVYSGVTPVGTVVIAASDLTNGYVDVALASLGPDGVKSLTATVTDASANVSGASPALAITLDTTAPAAPAVVSITTDTGTAGDAITSDQTLVFGGTAEANSTVEVFTGGVSIGTTTADGAGAWSFDYQGTTLADGSYSVTATAQDAAGNVSAASAPLAVTIDATAPAAPGAPDLTAGSDTGASNTDDLTNDTTPTLTGTAEPGSTVTITSDIDGVLGTALVDGAGNWTLTPVGPVSEGSHTLTVTATDVAGNTSVASPPLGITVDTTAPTLASFSSTTAAGTYGLGAVIDITATMNEPVAAGSQISVTLDTGDVVVLTAAADGTTLTGTYTVGAGDNSADLNVTGIVIASVQDIAGNAMVSTAIPGGQTLADNEDLVIDTTAPAAPGAPDLTAGSDTGSSSTDDLTNDTTPTLTGTAEPGSTVNITSDIDGVLGTALVDGAGNWTFTPVTPISGGTHSVTVTATDPSGNTSAASPPLAITVDTTAPAAPAITGMSTDSGAPGDGITSDNTLVFNGTAEPGSTVEVLVNGVPVGTTTADGLGNWTFDYSGTTLPDGTYAVTATATDAAGNTGPASPVQTVTVDTTPPAAPVVDNVTSLTLVPVLTGTAVLLPGETLTVTVNGATYDVTPDAFGNWTLDLATAVPASGALGAFVDLGVYPISATVTDLAGNTTPGAGTVTVLINDAPVVTTSVGALAYTENDPFSAVDPAVAVNDVDNATLASASLQITGGYVAGEDLLTFTSTGGITGSFNAGTGTLALIGPATLADWQTVLQSVAYQNTSDNPSTALRTVTLIVNDGALDSLPATRTINVTAVNDAPSLTNNNLAIADGATVTLTFANLGAADPDNAWGGLIYTASGITNGQFEFTGAPGTPITSFTQADVAAGLVVFVHAGNNLAPGYTIQAGDGTLFSAPSAASITFTASNTDPGLPAGDPPTGQGNDPGAVGASSPPGMSNGGSDLTGPTGLGTSAGVPRGQETFEDIGEPAPPIPVVSVDTRKAAAKAEPPVVKPESMTVASSSPTITRSSQSFAPEFAQTRRPQEITVDLGKVTIRDHDSEHLIQLDLNSIRMASLALSVGAIWWATRATGLLASLLSSLPAWRNFDPLPVLARSEEEDEANEEWAQAYDAQVDDETAKEEEMVRRRFSNEESQPIELEKLNV